MIVLLEAGLLLFEFGQNCADMCCSAQLNCQVESLSHSLAPSKRNGCLESRGQTNMLEMLAVGLSNRQMTDTRDTGGSRGVG